MVLASLVGAGLGYDAGRGAMRMGTRVPLVLVLAPAGAGEEAAGATAADAAAAKEGGAGDMDGDCVTVRLA